MNSRPSDDLVRQVTRCQERLYAYIRALVIRADDAREVLQETNVVLLRKGDQQPAHQGFEAWACRVAYYQVLSYRRDRSRDRHLFDAALLEKLAPHAEQAGAHGNAWLDALEECLDQLAPKQRELIAARYSHGETLKELAGRLSVPAARLATQLFRIRKALLDCIERKLATDYAS